MTYDDYRQYFINVKPLIKFNYLLKKCKISYSNFSHFINNNYQTVSIDKLNELYELLQNEVYEKIA